MVVVGTLLRALWTLRPPAPASGRLSVLQTVLSPVWRTCPVRTVHVSSAVCSGITKAIKANKTRIPLARARSKLFEKISSQIRMAVKAGGPNPHLNSALAKILQMCKEKNFSKASTDGIIQSAERAKLVSELKFDILGPGRCLLFVEVLTANSGVITSRIKHLLNCNGGKLFEKKQNNFNQKGVVVVSGQDITTERALELAIEVEAEDVQNTEDDEEKPQLKFICAVTKLNKMKSSLEDLGMQIVYAELQFIPNNYVSLNDDQMEEASALIEALNNCDIVARVWDNIKA